MHGSRSKIPSKKISSGSVARKDLITALKGYLCDIRKINSENEKLGSIVVFGLMYFLQDFPAIIFGTKLIVYVCRDSSVGIRTRYVLDDPGIESWWV
jgi:hypothetical protein